MISRQAIASYDSGAEKKHSWPVTAAWIAGAVALIIAGLIALHVIAQLDAMSLNLAHVSSRLETLQTMNQKLDRLDAMSLALRQMNNKLSVTNASLTLANQKLSSMAADSKTAGTSLDLMRRTLSGMGNDISVMSHKISGSFLFRSVK